MANYRVHWEIDVENVATPAAAARQALDSILRVGSIAHVFDVDDHEGTRTTVDLDYADEPPPVNDPHRTSAPPQQGVQLNLSVPAGKIVVSTEEGTPQ